MFVAQAIKGNFGFCIESVVGLFVDHLIVLFRKTDRTFVVCSEIARTFGPSSRIREVFDEVCMVLG